MYSMHTFSFPSISTLPLLNDWTHLDSYIKCDDSIVPQMELFNPVRLAVPVVAVLPSLVLPSKMNRQTQNKYCIVAANIQASLKDVV